MARKVRQGKVNSHALQVIARNYDMLRALCNSSDRGCYCSKSYEDIFQDTILYVAHDLSSFNMTRDEEVIELFLYRYKMIEFQTINDDKMMKEVAYADHLQTKETGTEEG